MKTGYEQYSDDELIREYRKGKKDAANVLIERYKQLVKIRARALFLTGGDREDLLQEGMLGLFQAIEGYEEGRASFQTFASLCITRQMYTAISAAEKKNHTPLNHALSLDDPSVLLKEEDGPETMFLHQEAIEEALRRLQEKLSSLEKEVLKLFLSGLDYKQIADRLQKTPKSIDNALQRIKQKAQASPQSLCGM